MKFVHQPLRGRGLVLRNFFHERLVVEAMNLLEFPVFTGEFENQRGA
jgi:hypothetical protein